MTESYSTTFLPEMQEYKGQRRVKPLPKRRRTSDLDPIELATVYVDASNVSSADPSGAPQPASPGVHPDFALYYQIPSPPFNDPHHTRIDSLVDSHGPPQHQHQQRQQQQREIFSSIAAYRNNTSGGGTEDDDEHVDGDYVDHLQQPGNTKKRKVPAAHSMLGGTNFDDSLGSLSGTDGVVRQSDETYGFSGGHLGGAGVPARGSSSSGDGLQKTGTATHPRKFRASTATMTGLKRKEMLKSRKRQVLAIVNSIPNTETLALDQALATQLGWYRPASGIHFRRKSATRRSHNISASSRRHLIPQSTTTSNGAIWEQQPFTFECSSTTTERLIATRAEVSILVDKFQKELDRQAAAAAQAARQAAAGNSESLTLASSAKSQRTRPSESTKSANARATSGASGGAPTSNSNNESAPSFIPSKGKSKKKKRSALANASNPHHLRNYIPSRLPNSGPPSTISAAQAALQFLGPAPIRFLSADVGVRRGTVSRNGGKRMSGTASLDDGVVMPDEWICAFCEYDLFYGTEGSYRHGIRARKKILRRRKRARERAARAASGVGPAAAVGSTMDDGETEDDGEYEADSPYEVAQSSGGRISSGEAQQMRAGSTGGDDGAG